MELTKLLQVKISKELYDDLVKEAIMSGLTVAEITRLRLSGKKIVDKSELEKENNKPRFRAVGDFRR